MTAEEDVIASYQNYLDTRAQRRCTISKRIQALEVLGAKVQQIQWLEVFGGKIPEEIQTLKVLGAKIREEIQALKEEDERLEKMDNGSSAPPKKSRNYDPKNDESMKIASFRRIYGEHALKIVRDIVALGGEIDLLDLKGRLGMVPDAHGKWPRSNLLPAVLRDLGCVSIINGKWTAPTRLWSLK